MKKITQYAGVILIVLGALTLAATRIPSLVSSNALLLTGLLLIVAGIMLHIRSVGGVAAEKERIVRHIEEVLAEIVDDVDALVGGLRESLRRLDVRLRPLVVGLGDALHAVRVKEEFVYLCHTALSDFRVQRYEKTICLNHFKPKNCQKCHILAKVL